MEIFIRLVIAISLLTGFIVAWQFQARQGFLRHKVEEFVVGFSVGFFGALFLQTLLLFIALDIRFVIFGSI